MKAPGFWWTPPDRPGWQARLLSPAASLWRAGAWLRKTRATPGETSAPVLCIGNATAGGAGKTPMVAALMQRLRDRGVAVHTVSRGHGGSVRGPHRVDPGRDTHTEVGDEPLLLSAYGPVWVARDRLAGARAAAGAGAGLILLDDGLQNPGLVKDAAILMVDAGQGFGNGRLIPAGPLREPAEDAVARADLVVLVGPPAARERAMQRWPLLTKAGALEAELAPLATGLPIASAPSVAFAGIGRPEKFFETLRGMGADLLATHAFPDHYAYRPAILRRLIAEARGAGALLLTTEKDAVRIPPALRAEILTVQVRLDPSDWAPIDALFDGLLQRTR